MGFYAFLQIALSCISRWIGGDAPHVEGALTIPTTLIRIIRWFVAAYLLVSVPVYADLLSCVSVSLHSNGRVLGVDICSGRAHTVALAASLQRAVAGATNLIVVGDGEFQQDGRRYLMLGVAVPSKQANGVGFCGAGTEDKLLLVELGKSHRLYLRDGLEIQSCLKSFALSSDQGTDLHVVLGSIADPSEFQLTWLMHPKYGDVSKTVHVRGGKLFID